MIHRIHRERHASAVTLIGGYVMERKRESASTRVDAIPSSAGKLNANLSLVNETRASSDGFYNAADGVAVARST